MFVCAPGWLWWQWARKQYSVGFDHWATKTESKPNYTYHYTVHAMYKVTGVYREIKKLIKRLCCVTDYVHLYGKQHLPSRFVFRVVTTEIKVRVCVCVCVKWPTQCLLVSLFNHSTNMELACVGLEDH